ncbi:hypothetical protein R3P38DRAFT_3117457 [Favolaschia claudopus]|uniref:F-box domain-containing protein n=1 Tax=Favolaschia claudopus TaxID=2862362 RepID=A0AAV9ZDZ8_9AGAR
MSRPSPLDIQELVDRCIDCLAGSPSDLLTCALVAHAWVYAAQSNLLRSPHTTNRRLGYTGTASLPEFYDTLLRYPHFARHVQDLLVASYERVPTELLEKLCHLSFTRLERLSVVTTHYLLPEASRRLLSLPTLRYLKILVFNRSCSTFAPVWKYCSPTIQHLSMRGMDISVSDHAFPILPGIQPIGLQSLWLDVIAGLDTLRNLALFPFDLSSIQALAITHISFKAHAILSTMPLQILMLDLTQGGVENLDLSLLPHLTTLRICFGPRFFTSSITTLATIVLPTTALMELDLALSSLPLSPPPIVEVIRSRDRMNFKVSEFPILSSKNMLHVCPNGSLDFWTGERVWWQGVIEKL